MSRPPAMFREGGATLYGWRETLAPEGPVLWNGAIQIVYGRSFEGWSGPGARYFEINQEFSHVAGIHWRPEHNAYCRFDSNGDLESVVSATGPGAGFDGVSLVTCQLLPLEEYLAAADCTLVRMFDFSLQRKGEFEAWPSADEVVLTDGDLHYRQKVDVRSCGYTRGVQLVRPSRSRPTWNAPRETNEVEFLAHDWRNKRVARISTGPEATSNYFQAENNSLPFETSPAFFRPEVLLKYKGDKEKYTIGDRQLICRASWSLRGFDVNDAGQVFAYICDLRDLPYSEKLHWLSFNEAPKAGISPRAFQTDFQGEFTDIEDPLERVLRVVRRWNEGELSWWNVREAPALSRVSKPVSSSRDEWADAFMDLSKLIVEGFSVSDLRKRLDALSLQWKPDEGSIVLLERLVDNAGHSTAPGLPGLRSIQRIRSKVKGHTEGEDAQKLASAAVAEHGSYGAHFAYVCGNLAEELDRVERAIART